MPPKRKAAEPAAKSSLADKTVCFTGALEMKRADAKQQAEAAGATVTGSVSAKTNILVAGPGAGAKMAEAQSKGVEVWTEQEFLDALSGSGSKKASGKKAAAAADPPASKKAEASPSKLVASSIVTTTDDSGDGATADPDAITAMAAEGLKKNVQVTAHHKLVQIEIATNTDKYFVMQTLSGETSGRKKETKHLVFTRWGRTGTKGQVKCEGPFDDEDEAASSLAKKFKEKTGSEISSASDGSFKAKAGKYDLVSGDTGTVHSVAGKDGGCLWQYYVGDGIDGKANGWYDYTTEAAEIVEGVYSEWTNNQQLDVRCVQSGTWCYKVEFGTMKQTNVTHPGRKERDIRRNA